MGKQKTHYVFVTQAATESDPDEWVVAACGREYFENGTSSKDAVTCKQCIAALAKTAASTK